MRTRLAIAAAVVLALAAIFVLAADEPVDSLAALQEGNRLFRNGQIEAAIEAYRQGYSPDEPHATLVYNLGTAYHHLDRLPEAVLWYRRAADSEDPWLQENLWLARRALGSQNLPPAGFLGRLTENRQVLRIAAVAIGWILLIVLVFVPRVPLGAVIGAAVLAIGLYGTALGMERWGPRPAVLLQDCHTPGGELPAGTEAWVRPLGDGTWRVAASSDVVCPAESVALVDPS